jgi:uncharacterized protein YodC (DUF2158 family)
MIRSGQMVRAGGSPPMLLSNVDADGQAECLVIDSRGGIRHRFFHVDQLVPLWLSLQPKSLWPEITQVDLIANQREEMLELHAKEERRRAARKSKRSRKVKRKPVAA